MGKKLYVGNLSYSVDNGQLEDMFSQYGTVRSAEVIQDRDSGRSKGFGFVEMADDNAAREATEKDAELRKELGVMVYFDVAQAQIQTDGQIVLDRKVAILNANPAVRLRITGACDERGSDQYNEALGQRRAAADGGPSKLADSSRSENGFVT